MGGPVRQRKKRTLFPKHAFRAAHDKRLRSESENTAPEAGHSRRRQGPEEETPCPAGAGGTAHGLIASVRVRPGQWTIERSSRRDVRTRSLPAALPKIERDRESRFARGLTLLPY